MARYWPSMHKYVQVWSSVAKYDQVFAIIGYGQLLDMYGQVWPGIGQLLTIMVKYGQVWSRRATY